MAYVKPKYEGEDFLEWYKTHYGKDYDGSTLNRSDGMQDQDWEIGNALYGTYKDRLAREEQYNNDKTLLEKGYGDAQSVADKTYNTQKDSLVGEYNKNQAELLKNYQSSASSLEKSKNQSLQSASITYDKLKKYLPTQIKAQGLGGLGVSESTMLQAHNNYAAQTGNIKNEYNANKTALEENYGTNKASLETAHENNIATLENQKLASDTERKTTLDQSLADLLTYYNSDMQGLKTDVGAITQKFFNQNKELQQGNYEDLASLISGDLKTEDLATFIQRIDSADIDDNQKALLKTLATNQVNNNITTRQNSTFENFKNVIANLTDTSIENAYAKIDALDITDNQKAQLKTLVDSQVANNQYTLREENKQQLLFDLETDYENASGADEWQNALNRLEQNKDLLDDTTYNYWKNRLQSKYDAVKKEEEETAQAELDERILTGKEYIFYNGANYKIKSQLNDSSNEIKHNKDFKEQLQNKFGTTNPYDSKIPNGTVLSIKCDSSGKNEFTYEDLGFADVTDWRNWIPGYNIYNWANNIFNFDTRYVVYYNGNWYSADKK